MCLNIFFCFILLFTSSSPCRKDHFAVSYFSTSLIGLIQVYNWEIKHHSLICCCGLNDILYILEPFYLPTELPTYPPSHLSAYLPNYLPNYLSNYLLICPLSYLLVYLPTLLFPCLPNHPLIYLPSFPPTYLSTYTYSHLPFYLPTVLPTFPPTFLPTYLSTYLPTHESSVTERSCAMLISKVEED